MTGLVARLIAAGTDPELVEEVAMLIAEKRLAETAIQTRRANDRERQTRRRNDMSRDVTLEPVTERDVTDDPSLSPSPLSSPHTPQLTPRPHTHPDIYPARVKADDFPRLDCAKPEVWRDFLKNRKAKRLPCTATAHKRLERDLEAMAARTGWPPGEVFEACVGKGWGAIYDPRENDNGRNQANRANLTAPSGRPMGRTEAAARAMLARVAGPSDNGGSGGSPVALPDDSRAIGYVP